MSGDEILTTEEFRARVGRLAQGLLAQYELSSKASVTMINHSENVTYRVDDPDRDRKTILRVHRAGYHSRQGIWSELEWLQALRRDAGVETPVPIAAKDGSVIQRVGSAELPQERYAVMFEFMAGHEPPEDNLVGPFERLGEVTARLHLHAKAWRQPAGFTRHTWDYEAMFGAKPTWGRWQDGLGVTGEAKKTLQRLAEALKRRLGAYGQGGERFGLVHADLRLANLLLEGERTKVIDFDDCGFSWYLYDLGSALSFIEHKPEVPELVASWVKGYRTVAPLLAEDEAEIDTFILTRRLLLVAWIGSHAETELAQSQGIPFTEGACRLTESYLGRFG
jgi:Ser/Thr protein kinase RdoA (MazF antagonist)